MSALSIARVSDPGMKAAYVLIMQTHPFQPLPKLMVLHSWDTKLIRNQFDCFERIDLCGIANHPKGPKRFPQPSTAVLTFDSSQHVCFFVSVLPFEFQGVSITALFPAGFAKS